jgi:hypothetical protein
MVFCVAILYGMIGKFREYVPDPKITADRERNNPDRNVGEGMSDDERMSEFAYTGDVRYLTPDLMQKMGIAIDDTEMPYSVVGPSNGEIEEQIFVQEGIDTTELRSLDASAPHIISVLLPLAIRPVTKSGNRELDEPQYLEETRDVIRRELSRFILERPKEFVHALFETLNPNSLASLEIIRYLEEEPELTKRFFDSALRSGQSRDEKLPRQMHQILEVYIDESDRWWKELNERPRDLYFVRHTMREFMFRIFGREEQLDDSDLYVPFEISKGRYAAFTLDKNRVYVAPESLSQDIAEMYKEGWTPNTTSMDMVPPAISWNIFRSTFSMHENQQ